MAMIEEAIPTPGVSPGLTGNDRSRQHEVEDGGQVERDQPGEEQAQRQTPKVEPVAEDLPKQEPDGGPPPQRTDP